MPYACLNNFPSTALRKKKETWFQHLLPLEREKTWEKTWENHETFSKTEGEVSVNVLASVSPSIINVLSSVCFCWGKSFTLLASRLTICGWGKCAGPSPAPPGGWRKLLSASVLQGQQQLLLPPPTGTTRCHLLPGHPSWGGCLLFMIVRWCSSLSWRVGGCAQTHTTNQYISLLLSDSSLGIHTAPFP